MNSFSRHRRQAGLSPEQVSELLGLPIETVIDYETEVCAPTPRETQILKGLAVCQRAKCAADFIESGKVPMKSSLFSASPLSDAMIDRNALNDIANPVPARRWHTEQNSEPKGLIGTISNLGFYEFFAGGGMARAGLGSPWKCLFANDFDHKKGKTYRANWGDGELKTADVRSLAIADLPRMADLVWASFPCQDLSLAGAGAGLKGERSGAFWPFWKLMQALRVDGRAPKIIVLENVCGTLTSHGGKDFATICGALQQESYKFGALIIDAALFVPQSRPRLFIVAVRDDIAIPDEFTAAQAYDPWHTRGLRYAHRKLSPKIQANWIWWSLPTPPKRNTNFADIIEDEPATVEWHTRDETAQLLRMMSDINRAKVNVARKSAKRMVGGIYKRTRRDEFKRKVQRAEIRFDDIAGCLRTPAGGSSRQLILVMQADKVRSRLISSRETARLMGLPDDYKLPDNYNEAYFLTGDGVVVPVVRHLAHHIFEPLLEGLTSAKAAA